MTAISFSTATVTLTNTGLLYVDALAYATATGEDANADADARAVSRMPCQQSNDFVERPAPRKRQQRQDLGLCRANALLADEGSAEAEARRSTRSRSMQTLLGSAISETRDRRDLGLGGSRRASARRGRRQPDGRTTNCHGDFAADQLTAPAPQPCAMRARSRPRRSPVPAYEIRLRASLARRRCRCRGGSQCSHPEAWATGSALAEVDERLAGLDRRSTVATTGARMSMQTRMQGHR